MSFLAIIMIGSLLGNLLVTKNDTFFAGCLIGTILTPSVIKKYYYISRIGAFNAKLDF